MSEFDWDDEKNELLDSEELQILREMQDWMVDWKSVYFTACDFLMSIPTIGLKVVADLKENILNKIKCDICNKMFTTDNIISGYGIRHEVEKIIKRDYENWSDANNICKQDFDVYRTKYINTIIKEEDGIIEKLQKDVLASINDDDIIAENINASLKETLNLGDKVSDKVASFGGSWRFIIIFFLILTVWIVINSIVLIRKPFDPYPFILMNLILSCLAAIQAPIIMMSQNRQEKKDRIRSENDYKVNLKSEIEIRTLHEKVDHLLLDQWSKMMKIQEVQIEILEEIKEKMES